MNGGQVPTERVQLCPREANSTLLAYRSRYRRLCMDMLQMPDVSYRKETPTNQALAYEV